MSFVKSSNNITSVTEEIRRTAHYPDVEPQDGDLLMYSAVDEAFLPVEAGALDTRPYKVYTVKFDSQIPLNSFTTPQVYENTLGVDPGDWQRVSVDGVLRLELDPDGIFDNYHKVMFATPLGIDGTLPFTVSVFPQGEFIFVDVKYPGGYSSGDVFVELRLYPI